VAETGLLKGDPEIITAAARYVKGVV